MPAINFKNQFAEAVKNGVKRQTIRALRKDGRMPAKRGDILALYTGMRTKSCRKLLNARCSDVRPIELHAALVIVDGGDGWIRTRPDLDNFARADGFRDWSDMAAWFDKTHGLPFEGVLIQWDELRDSSSENGDEFQRRVDAGECCRAGRDGDCIHPECPQNRDGEPHATGRHCPLDCKCTVCGLDSGECDCPDGTQRKACTFVSRRL
ncbi:MAG: hypothetical protein HQL35_08220 [Alphaproteobacteria bacterium]|nr:hypothetical protein [Alphaproteobacteria bacterium]